MTSKNQNNPLIPDLSTIILILSNILIIFFAVTENWSLVYIMLIYWAQSVIIGFFTFIRILTLKKFSTKNFRINRRSAEPTKATKYFTAFFFLVHYGIFHLGYLTILLTQITTSRRELLESSGYLLITFSIIIFFINHLFSFIYNYKADSQKIKNIGKVMFFPYARIIPMHLTIVFGFFLVNTTKGLIFFLILKTIADIIMHLIEHK